MTPLTPEHLAAIRYRAEHHWPASAADVPVLLAALAAMEQDRDRLTYERDQYRAESQRLGDQAQHLVNRVTAERERANEAARLSAAARDANDDLLKQVEAAHEKVSIVEESRLDLIVENHRLEHERDQGRDALAAMEQDRDRLREQAQRLNRPMVARLHRCAADTSSNWDGQITIYPPEARELTALIDAFDMSAEVKRGYDETLAKLTAELAQASTADAETPEDTEAIYDEAAAKLRKARAQRDQARAAGFADA